MLSPGLLMHHFNLALLSRLPLLGLVKLVRVISFTGAQVFEPCQNCRSLATQPERLQLTAIVRRDSPVMIDEWRPM